MDGQFPAAGATSEAHTIVDLLHALASTRPDDPAYTFLGQRFGGGHVRHLTWHQVCRQASTVATNLRFRCAAGARVTIAAPLGSAYVAALLGTLQAGCTAVPLDEPGTESGMVPVLRRSRPAVLLAAATSADAASAAVRTADPLRHVATLTIEQLAPLRLPRPTGPDRLAYPDIAVLRYDAGPPPGEPTALTHSALLAHAGAAATATVLPPLAAAWRVWARPAPLEAVCATVALEGHLIVSGPAAVLIHGTNRPAAHPIPGNAHRFRSA
ncbi:AMP-binding protein [Nocardia sp. IFM 10818]